MPVRRVAAVLLTSAAALGAAGCAGSGTSSDDSADDFPAAQRPIVTAVSDLSDAAGSRDYEQLCRDQLATALVDRLSAAQGTDACPDQLEESLKEVGQVNFDVVKGGVRVAGDRATARVTSDLGNRDATDVLQFVRQDDRWKLSGL